MGVLQKLYELIFEILFMSEPCFGFVFLETGLLSGVLQSSIPRAFPIGIGVEYPGLEIICLDLESGLTTGDLLSGISFCEGRRAMRGRLNVGFSAFS